MRKLNYSVGIDSLSPSTVQFGGIAGEHNVTEIKIEIDEGLSVALSEVIGAIYWRIDIEDGAGTVFTGNVTEYSSDTITAKLPQYATKSGGNIELRVIFSVILEGEIEKILYSFPIRLKLDNGINGAEQDKTEAEDIGSAIAQVKECTVRAESAVENAKSAVETALSAAKESGEFNGADGEKGDIGEQGPQGEIGPQGPQGPKGDTGEKGADGDDYILTEDDKSEIAGMVEAVKYSTLQTLEPEQQAQARENIGLHIVSDANGNSADIPDFEGTTALIQEFADLFLLYSRQAQLLSAEQQSQVRTNIDAEQSLGNWEKLYEITTDGVVSSYELYNYADGTPLKLKALGAKVIATNALSTLPSNTAITLNAVYKENNENKLRVQVPLFNILSTTANLVAVCTIINDRGIWQPKFCPAVENKASKVSEENYIPSKMFSYGGVTYPHINYIGLAGAVPLAAGNIIEIWGIRA